MNSPFLLLDMMMLPKNSGTAIFNGELVLSDNLDNGLPEDNQKQESSLLNYPIKMTFNFIILCIKGVVSVQLNLKRYTLQANDVLCALKGDIGEYYGASSGNEEAQVAIIAYTDEYFQVKDAIDIQQQFRKNPCFHLQSSQRDELLAVYGLIKTAMQDEEYLYKKGVLLGHLQALIYRISICDFLWLQTQTDRISKPNRKQDVFNEFIQKVRANYTKERSIRFYADQLCFTPKYLSNIIYQVSGRYAGEWINDYVILEAKALIKTNRYTISQISDMLNFANPSFFGQYFKRSVGCSPADYQKSGT